MNKVAKALEVAERVVKLRQELVLAEGELAVIMGEAKPAPRRKAAPKVKAEPKVEEEATSTAGKGQRQTQVLALAKQGLSSTEIAEKLSTRRQVITVALWRLKQKGLLTREPRQ